MKIEIEGAITMRLPDGFEITIGAGEWEAERIIACFERIANIIQTANDLPPETARTADLHKEARP